MSYRITVLFRPEGKYPFLLATEADGLPMTKEELEALHSECDRALRESDEHEMGQSDLEQHQFADYAKKIAEKADSLRKAQRENAP